MNNYTSNLVELTVQLGEDCRYESLRCLVLSIEVFKEEHECIPLAFEHSIGQLLFKILWQFLEEMIFCKGTASRAPDKRFHVIEADFDVISAKEFFGSLLANFVEVLFH